MKRFVRKLRNGKSLLLQSKQKHLLFLILNRKRKEVVVVCVRYMKERYAVTDMRKLFNRMQFGVPEENFLEDNGMLGRASCGKLRVSIGLQIKVANKFKHYGSSSGANSGLTSISLVFTPVQGIEFTNPQSHEHHDQLGSGTQRLKL
ncbi:hypothetical protein Dsin_000828 [Dipteronia sinensis]|uniref:Prp31 C-terminal domain-containing protein n=1 Tax=Dipteronia sinensis TaxID=43782 RepID=A0AAE0B355_9ROSI|nr:hypothetical protein Dsin_000828 [Dipteronia sinensis]